MSKRKLGIGIVGCGMISYFHARAIAEIEEAQLVGAHSDRAEAAERFANEFDTRIFHSFEDMLACPDVDIVSICTPSGLHAPMAVKEAKAGKHIIVEKPVAITREQIDSIEKATKESRVKLAVISQHRFSPAVQFVKKAIDEGAFGKILIVDINMNNNVIFFCIPFGSTSCRCMNSQVVATRKCIFAKTYYTVWNNNGCKISTEVKCIWPNFSYAIGKNGRNKVIHTTT